MERYDERKDLAPRDIVARAIDNELKTTGTEHVWLDCRHFNTEKFVEHFPNIYEKCKSIGIDISKDMIPVAPAAHYSCGGIKVDEWGQTSIRNLYAVGECSSTGLHGANRLASNSCWRQWYLRTDVLFMFPRKLIIMSCPGILR